MTDPLLLKNLDNNEALLDMLVRALRIKKDYTLGNGERLGMATTLTNKFLHHALTLCSLLSGTHQSLPSCTFDFIDFASINVVTRALIEAFLVFHYLFCAPKNDEEAEFRFCAYRIMGFQFNQDICHLVGTREAANKICAQKEQLNELKKRLASNITFQHLSKKQRGQVENGREWKFEGWRDIAKNAGFSNTLAEYFYRYLCDFSHSGIIGVAGSLPTNSKEEETRAISGILIIINIVIANIIQKYCDLFPEAKFAIIKDIDGVTLVRQYIRKGNKLDRIFSI